MSPAHRWPFGRGRAPSERIGRRIAWRIGGPIGRWTDINLQWQRGLITYDERRECHLDIVQHPFDKRRGYPTNARREPGWSQRGLNGFLFRRALEALPVANRKRYEEEWMADLAQSPSRMQSLKLLIGIRARARLLSQALSDDSTELA